MPLQEETQKLVEEKLGAYCKSIVPATAHNQVRLSFSFLGNTVTVFEEQHILTQLDKWTKTPIAQFRLNVVDKLWRLYCTNPKREMGWVLCPGAEPTTDFSALLLALDQSRSSTFWD